MSTKIITPPAMLSFPNLLTARAGMNGGKEKFSASLVFLPGTNLTALEMAANEAAEEKFGAKGPKLLAAGGIRSPFRRDGASKGYPEGSVFVNVRSDRKPGCVYLWPDPATGKPAIIADADIVKSLYPGAMVRASLSAFGYDSNGNKGVSFGLHNVQLVDGTTPRIDGNKAATDEFEADLSAAPPSLAEHGAE